ncbi:MAG: intermembrane transport protein PqiB [Pseudomonadota bacterium]
MTDTSTVDPLHATRRRQARLSPIWIVPIVALLIGVWLVYDNVTSNGPQITLEIEDAEGIEAGTTLIKLRNVEVGLVEQVNLSEDLTHTLITARMSPDADRMLAADTRFWVVKPRIGRDGISGLNTVLSGAYIQLQPGMAAETADTFEVLAQPPVSDSGTEGVHVRLVSDLGNSLRVGDPVSYQGFTVGRVEEAEFDSATRQMQHRLFIESPYDDLITENTRFWNASGIDMRLDSQGVRVSMESFEAVLIGGATFGYLQSVTEGPRVEEDTSFSLYPDQEQALQDSYSQFIEYVLLIDNTVRGLVAGAPVEYRGIRIGTVVTVPWKFSAPVPGTVQEYAIPVLIRIEPQRIDGSGYELNMDEWTNRFEGLFQQGLRANLKTGNLLTGAMFVDVNLQSEVDEPYVASIFESRPVFPTISGGFAQIEEQITSLLDKLNNLPVEPVLASLDQTLQTSDAMLAEVRELSASLKGLVEAPDTKALPASINGALAELRTTLQGFTPDATVYQELTDALQSLEGLMRDLQPVARTLGEQPNALIFNRSETEDPQPQARP